MSITWDKVEERVKVDRLIEGMSNVQKYETVKRLIETDHEADTKSLFDPFMLGVCDALREYIPYSFVELKEMFRTNVRPRPLGEKSSIDPRTDDPEYKHGYFYAKKVYNSGIVK